jgi:hypothetical protein
MPKWTARVALGALIVWSAMSARYALPDRINPPWRETAQWVEQHYGTRPLVAEERFCSEAMTYYSRGGPVRLWRDLDRTAQSGAFLFACRPAHCKKATETLAARASLVKTWHWHDDAGKTRFNQLMLYWVRAATPRDGLAIYGAATRR